MVDTYLTTQAMAVRRQADRRRGVSSLAKLIEQVRDRPAVITREFWIAQWSDPDDRLLMMEAERGWEEQYAGTVGYHLDRAIPAVDLETLLAGSQKVKDFVDAHIAHSGAPLEMATPSNPIS
jgi:hypothetical protein